jgi:hypothetical protein
MFLYFHELDPEMLKRTRASERDVHLLHVTCHVCHGQVPLPSPSLWSFLLAWLMCTFFFLMRSLQLIPWPRVHHNTIIVVWLIQSFLNWNCSVKCHFAWFLWSQLKFRKWYYEPKCQFFSRVENRLGHFYGLDINWCFRKSLCHQERRLRLCLRNQV